MNLKLWKVEFWEQFDKNTSHTELVIEQILTSTEAEFDDVPEIFKLCMQKLGKNVAQIYRISYQGTAYYEPNSK